MYNFLISCEKGIFGKVDNCFKSSEGDFSKLQFLPPSLHVTPHQ